MAGRVSVELTPISPLFIRFAADNTLDNSLPRQGYRLLPGLPPGNEPVLSGNYDTRADLYTVLGHRQQVITHGESLLVEYAINQDLSFKSISALRKSKSWAPIDFDSSHGHARGAGDYHDGKEREFSSPTPASCRSGWLHT